MSIGVALIGSGIFAREEHLPAVEAAEHLSLKAIYSRSLKSAKSLATDTSRLALYSDDSGPSKGYVDLLSRSDINAVIIALPIENQPDYIRQALLAGKHVLSEKPVAENLKDAQELIRWYHGEIDSKKIFWAVAENYRYLNSLNHAREQVRRLGRLLGFRVKAFSKTGIMNKYFNTAWRKAPTHQGGFVLDAGVHFAAALRLLLGPENTITRISAFSSQLQEHLPPVDTVDAILKTKSGVSGTFSVSFGTTMRGAEYVVACEGGTVTVSKGRVATVFDGKEEVEEITDEKTGVPTEVRNWGEALALGKRNDQQIPEEALADLELLELMLKSGDDDGVPMECALQI